MAMYIVVPLKSNFELIRNRVMGKIVKTEFYELSDNAGFLINYAGTTIDLCKHLDITTSPPDPAPASPVGPAFVAPISNYFGLGNPNMWEWLATKFAS